MRIAALRTFRIGAGIRNVLLVKVEADNETFGWGESGLSGRELAVEGAIRHFEQFLLGRDPRRIGALWQEMYRGAYFEGGRVIAAAIGAIDIALHDLVARSHGVPVHAILGGAHRDRIPCFTTSLALTGPQAIDDARGLVDEGWQAIRFLPGPADADAGGRFDPRESIAMTSRWLVEVRRALGADVVLGLDYHHRLSPAEAASFCQRLTPGTLDFLEEPIRAESRAAYAAFRRLSDVPLAIGEEFTSKWDFAPFIEDGLLDFCRIDVANAGGFTEAMKIAGLCEAHYIDVMPHNPLGPIATAAQVHFCAAVPNLAWLEERTRTFSFDDDMFPGQLHLDGTSYRVPQGPGLGVEFNEEMVTAEPDLWEAPRLHRDDGSYTNW